MAIKWKRADEGFVMSHDGQWKIEPLYWGCTRPQMYRLYREGKTISTGCSTQREAKEEAEQWLERNKGR